MRHRQRENRDREAEVETRRSHIILISKWDCALSGSDVGVEQKRRVLLAEQKLRLEAASCERAQQILVRFASSIYVRHVQLRSSGLHE